MPGFKLIYQGCAVPPAKLMYLLNGTQVLVLRFLFHLESH